MHRPYAKMTASPTDHLAQARRNMSVPVFLSYVLDWVVLIVTVGIAAVLGNLDPHMRPFSLNDPDISFPYTEHETVPLWLLVVLMALVPVVIIAIVSLIFVPGATVPKDTPMALIWKRKLWELHVGWLGLLLSVGSAFFFTQCMKNLFGKPRPDLLDRCQPDLANAAKHVIGGFAGENALGKLYKASICTQKDSSILNDGFASYPSGHSSTSAAGLVYLSLFLASKFAVTIPFAVPQDGTASAITHSAFPSRHASAWENDNTPASSPMNPKHTNSSHHNAKISSLRRQAAGPPLYLLVLVLAPFCCSVWISSSRWYDFRHHGFDILFGYIMGLITAIFSFRYYHLPIQSGAGWAWGPRSRDRAFWAGVGRLGYADEQPAPEMPSRAGVVANDVEYQDPISAANTTQRVQRPTNGYGQNTAYDPNGPGSYGQGPFQEVEMERMDNRMNNRI